MDKSDVYAWLSEELNAYNCEAWPLNDGSSGSFHEKVEYWQPCGYMTCRVNNFE